MAAAKVGMTGVLVLGFIVIVLVALLPDIVPLSEGARTADASEAGLTCTTGASDTSCGVTLAAAHQYSDTSEMTVTETAPGAGDKTAETTVGTDRLSLTVAGLATSTAYTFNVAYKVVNPDISSQLNDVLRFLPMLLVFGAIVLVWAAVAKGLSVARA